MYRTSNRQIRCFNKRFDFRYFRDTPPNAENPDPNPDPIPNRQGFSATLYLYKEAFLCINYMQNGELTYTANSGGNGQRTGGHLRGRRQGRFWILTAPIRAENTLTNPNNDPKEYRWSLGLPEGIQWIKGQLERGEGTGYLHWQLVLSTPRKVSIRFIKQVFGESVHAELTRSDAAEDYVWKEETCVSTETRFEIGKKKSKRNKQHDWDDVRKLALQGDFEGIPSDIYIRYYRSLQSIAVDNLRPVSGRREVVVLWGETGAGKSYDAWQIAPNAYPKTAYEKWWDAYKGEPDVIIDEFRGGVPISCALTWFDEYACLVPTKGSHRALNARRIIITSNLDPRDWYANVDQSTRDALMRRLRVFRYPDDRYMVKSIYNLE